MKGKRNSQGSALTKAFSVLLAAAVCAGAVPMINSVQAADEFEDVTDQTGSDSTTFEDWDEWQGDDSSSSSSAESVKPAPSTPAPSAPAPSAPAASENTPAPAPKAQEAPATPEASGAQAGLEEAGEPEMLLEDAEVRYGDKENPRKSAVTLDGIDVSNWQKTIDLKNVDADFVILKATGGLGFVDKSFERFADDILSSGKLFGFYHYANDIGYKAGPEEEAAFFYAQTEQYIGKGIPILDYEDPELLRTGTDWAYRFLEHYYALSGVKPMVYMSSHWARSLDWTKIADAGYVLWVANYGKNEEQVGYRETEDCKTDGYGTGAFEEYWMHQYTSNGKLDGYEGRLDLNKFYGTISDWQSLTIPEPLNRPMFRLYNTYTGEHFYTGSRAEQRELIRMGWKDEGTGWIAPKNGKNVYRLYNPNDGDHHYTMDVNERDTLIGLGWNYEGIGWVSEDKDKGTPVYRAYNPNAKTGTHHYTTSKDEINELVKHGWQDEDIAWYGLDVDAGIKEMKEAESVNTSGQQTYRNNAKF